MKKWDSLLLLVFEDIITIHSSNLDEINKLVEIIFEEGPKYFSYVNNAGKHKLDIKKHRSTIKGHGVEILFSPCANFRYSEDNTKISEIDLHYFALNIVISNGWLPYPGNGDGTRFIKYYG
jgi:hypothetical protein